MLARVIICLLALACIMPGVQAFTGSDLLDDLRGGTVIALTDFQGAESLSITIGYMLSGAEVNSTKLQIDPTKKYVLLVVEKEKEED